MKRRVFLGLPVILGILFYIWYIFHASDNVAYSDYIRLINSYLPDVTNPAKFFVPDILTRVPITYLGRIINVKLFGYNAYFDMILGVLSLGAGAAVLALYAERNRSVGYLSFLLIQFVYFSLNKWEMMTNGTGWVCTLSISGFLFHFAVLDHAAATRCRNMSDRVLLAILPILLVVLVAGPYSGGYAVILVLAYGALWLADRRGGAETSSRSWSRKCRRTWCIGALTTVLAMVLYLWSSSQAVYVHRGAVTDVSIAQENPPRRQHQQMVTAAAENQQKRKNSLFIKLKPHIQIQCQQIRNKHCQPQQIHQMQPDKPGASCLQLLNLRHADHRRCHRFQQKPQEKEWLGGKFLSD